MEALAIRSRHSSPAHDEGAGRLTSAQVSLPDGRVLLGNQRDNDGDASNRPATRWTGRIASAPLELAVK